MKRIRQFILGAVLSTLLFSPGVEAQQVTGRLGTAIYTWKPFDSVGTARSVIRGYETFQFGLSQGNFALQTAGTASMNLNAPFGELGDVRISNLFLRWKNAVNGVDVSLGRIPVFAGVGIGTVDGGMVKIRSEKHVGGMIYGGANVSPTLATAGTDNLSERLRNNFLLGGQVTATMFGTMHVSASYMNRRIAVPAYYGIRPDSLLNPISMLFSPEPRSQQYAGVDIRYECAESATLYGRYDYDLNFERMLRGELSGRLPLSAALAVTGDFMYRQPWLSYHTFFDVFPVSSTNEYGGGLEYAVGPAIWTFGKVAYVRYTDTNTIRYTVGVNSPYWGLSYSGATGYAGELTGISAQARYPLMDRKVIPSLQAAYSSYRLSAFEANRSTVFSLAGGGCYYPIPQLGFDLQVQWLNNPYYAKDVRLFAKIDYWFSHNLRLFGGEGVGHE